MSNKAEFEVVLDDEVSPGAKKATASVGRLKNAFDKFQNSGAGKTLEKFAGALKTGLVVAGTAAAGVAASITSMTVGMVDFNQRSVMGFKALAQAGEDPQKSFQDTIDLIKRFGLDMKDTTAAVLSFKASGFTQGKSEELVKMGADMRVLGASSEEVKRAFLAIGQIKSAGTLQGDELNQLAEAKVPKSAVFEELAKSMGKTVPEILKLKEAGQIGADQAIDAIGKAMLRLSGGKEFGEAGKRAADGTLSGMAGRLKSAWDDMFRRTATGAEGPIVSAFHPLFNRLMELFDRPGTSDALVKVVTAIANAAEKAFPFVEMFVETFGSAFMDTIPIVIDSLKMVVDAFGQVGGSRSTADTVKMIAKAMGEMAAVLTGAVLVAIGLVVGAITFLASVWNFWKGMGQIVIDALGRVIFVVVDTISNLMAIFTNAKTGFFEKMWDAGAAIMNGLINGIKSLLMIPGDLIMGMADGLITAFKTTLGIASPSKVFEEMGRNTALGFNLGLNGEMPTIQGMSGQLNAGAAAVGAPSGGGGSMTFAPVITVPISGSATEADGQAFGSGITKELDRYFSSFMDRTALENAAPAAA